MNEQKTSVAAEFAAVTEHWRPRVVARLNGQEVKVAKFRGPFVWHRHDDADEMFLVWRGTFDMEFRDRTVTLSPGDLIVVPRGVEHRPNAAEEVEVMLFEPQGTRNTGNVEHPDFTAPQAPEGDAR
ncbi:MAG: cupin domain-containing protein [Candidatus Eisenbacteria bacterium]|jgi:mannose-6-phosphate isomerase-like protein (cupin superfamily)|nr:cupin domain-containing protein [Candidatus Eisenbacteria bacterium]MBP8137051.1 cupin domain-containing protein [Candidatus Eisenbacteria bacterium]